MTSNPTVKIDPEFQALIPPLTPDEAAMLEKSLLADGCRDPLVLWKGTNILLDGHNRYRICTKKEIWFRTIELAMDNREAAMAWILTNQLGRRNLSPYCRIELAMVLEPLLTAAASKRREAGMADGPKAKRGLGKRELMTMPNRVRAQIAKASGSSDNTVFQAMVIAKEADEQTKAKLRTGETTINAVFKEIRPDSTAARPRCTIALDDVEDALKQLLNRGDLEFLKNLSDRLATEVARKHTAAKRGLSMFGNRTK